MLSQRREIHERQRPCESLARSQTLRGRDPNWEGCPIEAGNPRLLLHFVKDMLRLVAFDVYTPLGYLVETEYDDTPSVYMSCLVFNPA